jgi:hypothetical protein
MAVIGSQERFDNRGEVSMTGGRKLDRTFEVLSDNYADTADDVIDGIGAYIGAAHPSFPICLVEKISAEKLDDSPFWWLVKVEYAEPKMPDGTPPNTEAQEPQDQDPQFKVSFSTDSITPLKDLDDHDFVNSAGEPFESPPVISFGVASISIMKKKLSISIAGEASKVNSINSDTFLGLDQYTCRVAGIEAVLKSERAFVFWEVTYTIAYNPIPFHPFKILDQGRNVKKDGKLVPATDDFGKEYPSPVLLNTSGEKTDTPEYKDFKVYEFMTFSGNIA